MPSAPLFYQPLVTARILATPIGETDVFQAKQVQDQLTNENYQAFKPAMDKLVQGFTQLQQELPGSRALERPQFSFDDAGYIANRIYTTLRLHPEMLDTASPDQAAQIGAKLVQEGQKELSEQLGFRAVGDRLEIDPTMTHILRQHWEGKRPLDSYSASYLAMTANRELQRAVTPQPPDSKHPQLQWVDDGAAYILGMWPGAATRTLEALGVKADAAAVEKQVDDWRRNIEQFEPAAGAAVTSLTALLGAAGIAGTDRAARDAAFQVLQSTPLEGVPAGIAQSIVATAKLPPEAAGYVAGRIVETGGSIGNVKGLLAEIEALRQPAPKPPTPPEPPSGEEPKPDPKPEPDPKPDPPKPDPDPKPDPPKPEPDPKPDPPKPDPPKVEEPFLEPTAEEIQAMLQSIMGGDVTPPAQG